MQDTVGNGAVPVGCTLAEGDGCCTRCHTNHGWADRPNGLANSQPVQSAVLWHTWTAWRRGGKVPSKWQRRRVRNVGCCAAAALFSGDTSYVLVGSTPPALGGKTVAPGKGKYQGCRLMGDTGRIVLVPCARPPWGRGRGAAGGRLCASGLGWLATCSSIVFGRRPWQARARMFWTGVWSVGTLCKTEAGCRMELWSPPALVLLLLFVYPVWCPPSS